MRRLAALLLLVGAPAFAQGYVATPIGPPAIVNGSLVQPMSDGTSTSTPLTALPGYATTAQATALRAGAVSYQDDTPAGTGSVIAMAAGIANELLHGASTVAACTVRLPPAPTDGQVARISSQMVVTALTVQDATGAAVAGGSLALGVFGVGSLWQFRSGGWTRIG